MTFPDQLLQGGSCEARGAKSSVALFVLSGLFSFGTTSFGESDSESTQPERDYTAAAAVPLTRVGEGLYRSAQINPANVASLHAAGITTVISLNDYSDNPQAAAAAEQQWLAANHISFIWMPWAGMSRPTVAQITKVYNKLIAPELGTILIHCEHGHDRTGMAVAAYRIGHDSWAVQDAIAELREMGHAPVLYWWDNVLYDFAASL